MRMRRGEPDSIPCECMDLVELAHRDRIYPVMFCRMTIRGKLDAERLKRAVKISAGYVPEILYSVDFKRGRFVNRNLTADHVVWAGNNDWNNIFRWDLAADTQVKIIILPESRAENLVIGMSHILTDGGGFLQYLYLLSAIYNEKKWNIEGRNQRDIKVVLRNVPFLIPQKHRVRNRAVCALYTGNTNYSICSPVSSPDFERIHKKANALHVSINDVLLAAYSRVILRRLGERQITIPCPADFRKINPVSGMLTIGNMTGMYRAISVSVADDDSFDEILRQVHKEIRWQREKRLCFQGIAWLRLLYDKIPAACLIRLIRRNYKIRPASYTNIGSIDSDRLYFSGCNIEGCYITGTYRKAPDFQLTVSTFKNVCTLNCTLSGNIQRKTEGGDILEEIKRELIEWADK